MKKVSRVGLFWRLLLHLIESGDEKEAYRVGLDDGLNCIAGYGFD